MGIRVECDWCRRKIEPGERYVTVQIDGQIVTGHHANEPKDVGGPARVYCGLDRYEDDDPAANGYTIGGGRHHRPSCASRMLAALDGNPAGRTDMGLEWRLVAQVAPSATYLIEGPVDTLELGGRVRAALKKAGVDTVRQLAQLTGAQWQAIPGITERGAEEILMALHRYQKVKPKDLVERTQAGAEA